MSSVNTNRRQGVNAGAAIKVPVRVATTANITLSGLQTIDGVTVVADDRVLVKNQTTQSQNGIYVASSSTWQRALDFDGVFDVVEGTLVHVNNGTTNAESMWRVDTDGTITVGSTSIDFDRALVSSGSSISFTQSGSGAVERDLQSKARERKSLEDFGAVGDGVTDDTSAWATALSTMGSSNFELHGSPGATYLIGATGIAISSKTNARIVGDGAKIKVGSVATQSPSGLGSTVIFLDTCTKVEFSGWEIDGNSKASNLIGMKSNTECVIKGNRFSTGGLSGQVFALGNTRCKYLDNECINGTGASRGFWLGNYATGHMEADVEVSGNVVRSMGATGIVLSSNGGRCYGNHIQDLTGGSCIIFGGANGFSSSRLAIFGNTCVNAVGHGIQSDVAFTTVADIPSAISISGNVCYLNDGSGIYAVNIYRSTINGNVCFDNNNDAVGDADGILVDDSDGITVVGNLCYDSRSGASRTQRHGISLIASLNSIDIKNGSIVGNTCYNNLTSGIHCANVAAANLLDNVVISSNTCVDNGAYGIFAEEASSATIQRLSVTGNVCRGNGTDDLRVSAILDVALAGNLYTSEQGVVYTFTLNDATPSVKGGRRVFATNNGIATTITAFDDGVPGQEIHVIFGDGNTTVDFTGTSLKGNAGVDFTAVANDSMFCVYDGTNWYCRISDNTA